MRFTTARMKGITLPALDDLALFVPFEQFGFALTLGQGLEPGAVVRVATVVVIVAVGEKVWVNTRRCFRKRQRVQLLFGREPSESESESLLPLVVR